ncbi:Hypothetical protein R9X50_00152300 [Acrodontium crateriforme]|uniref:Chitinase n=1 Tax=Acrodontium crateriforme TaxID=150365 RepID=A0AAQ3M0W0_9PEZI|nr:Hypothetical protein R9X50_00152300 [Acrodontium crateriforme]
MPSDAIDELLPIGQGPKVILYHQTHHKPNNGPPISLLPLITNKTGITHIILAAIHLNDEPGDITLNNDNHPDHEKFTTLWAEIAWMQAWGIKVLGMLGGAAQGTFARLESTDPARFERYYAPLKSMIETHKLNGLDLDIEEPTTLVHTIHLIDRLRADFGPDFLITLAPVATALLIDQPHLSGPKFNYHTLEQQRGHEIAWYNVQFYNGWGDARTTFWYDAIIRTGWKPERVVFGLLTNPGNGGSGYVPWEQMQIVLLALKFNYPSFGGVMGWEYFNALPGGDDRPWEWAKNMSQAIRRPLVGLPSSAPTGTSGQQAPIRPYGGSTAPPPPAPAHPYPAESVKTLQDLGFSQQHAIAALNSTNGNVEYAAGLLFQD